MGFVSTNSITQGEQVPLMWTPLIRDLGIKINFAHRTFGWSNEARGNAAVHCVIIGFSVFDKPKKRLFDYEKTVSEPTEIMVDRINAYLNSGVNVFIKKSQKPLFGGPAMNYGSMPIDGGFYLFTDEEKNDFIKKEPGSKHLFRKFMGSSEFIKGISRWCLWLKNVDPMELRALPLVIERIESVRRVREASTAEPTRKSANFPTLFFYDSQPEIDYLAVPEVSSERRRYIPIGFLSKTVVASNKLYTIPGAKLWHFGLLTSLMHMTWMKYTAGRLKSDFQYSNSIVYNNFPFPLNSTDAQKQKVEAAAQAVLDTRAKYPNSSLADLYDPLTMPPDLVKAHQALDKAVDLCYRSQAFTSELNRIEFLFGLYEQYTAPMFKDEVKKNKPLKKAKD